MGTRLDIWRALIGDQVRWFTAYGPTECTVTTVLSEDKGQASGAVVPIGRPIANTAVYVLDQQGRLLPEGCPGQLCIAGRSVTRGYLGKPALTAATFCPDPYAKEPGQRLYHTGDLARFNRRGDLCFLGRVDDQVKLRGYRIEPGEIDAVLLMQPEVLASITLVHEDIQQLISYVVTEQGEDFSNDFLEELRKQLPHYMIPASIVCMDRFPLLPSDKVDIRSLPKPGKDHAVAISLPMTPTQQLLGRLMADILQIQDMGLHDDFFAMGGHSLSATRLITAIADTFGVALPVSVVFQAPRLIDLARRVVDALESRTGAAMPAIQALPRDTAMPLSFAQSRLWFLDQLQGPSSSYNVHATLVLNGTVDVPALEAAMRRVLMRHEVMRTRFPMVDGSPSQVIAAEPDFELVLVELRDMDGGFLARTAADLPFDLARGPLFRAHLLRCSPTRHILLATMHHIISDGWSVGLFIEEMNAFYRHRLCGKGALPATQKVQYADYAAWQRTSMQAEYLEDHIGFWKDHLKGAKPLLELPLDFRRPKNSNNPWCPPPF